MTEEAPPDAKRRRIAAAEGGGCPQNNIRRLTDLPSGILAHAASFLSAPSRVLFAIALDGDAESSTINERSSAIAGNQWDVLDFGEIEKEVAENLSDADIKRVLQCIGAANNVKRLKLTNCTNITGTCLEPLRGSLIIEQIDLSHAGDNRKSASTQISCDHVLPILDSIIDREGCALKHLHFPSMWRNEPSDESDFHAFIVRYDEMMRGRGVISCLECNEILSSDGGDLIETATCADHYSTQVNTCHGCLKHYCYCCEIDDEKKFILDECGICKRDYCKGCSTLTYCSGCGYEICGYCYDCYQCECVKCNREVCPKCIQEGEDVFKCDYYDKCYCRECHDDDVNSWCNQCYVECCVECRVQRYRRGQLDCAECIKAITPHRLLLDENKQLHQRVEHLEAENAVLRRENEELRSRK